MSNRPHWPSLVLIVLVLLLAGWLAMHMPAGPEAQCVARGGEWFYDLRRCL